MKRILAVMAMVMLAGSVYAQGVSDVRIESRNGGGPATVTNGELWVAASVRDAAGTVLALDSTTRSLPTIDYAHKELHGGTHFEAYLNDLDLDVGETNGILILTTNSTKWAHMIFAADNSVAGTVNIYEGVVQTNLGAAITPYNNNRNSATLSDMKLYNSTGTMITNFGTTIRSALIGSANPLARTGGDTRTDNEIILKQNTYYFIETVGRAENGVNNIELRWYEHTNL
jgi:hypothetical protein